jgi:hypothetical protein
MMEALEHDCKMVAMAQITVKIDLACEDIGDLGRDIVRDPCRIGRSKKRGRDFARPHLDFALRLDPILERDETAAESVDRNNRVAPGKKRERPQFAAVVDFRAHRHARAQEAESPHGLGRARKLCGFAGVSAKPTEELRGVVTVLDPLFPEIDDRSRVAERGRVESKNLEDIVRGYRFLGVSYRAERGYDPEQGRDQSHPQPSEAPSSRARYNSSPVALHVSLAGSTQKV